MIYMEELWAEGTYQRDKVSHRECGDILDEMIKETESLWKEMGLDKPRLRYVTSIPNDGVATYICGSARTPIIILVLDAHRDDLYENIDFAELEISVIHELIHAYLEHMGMPTGLHPENLVEHFARDWYDMKEEMTPKQFLEEVDEQILNIKIITS